VLASAFVVGCGSDDGGDEGGGGGGEQSALSGTIQVGFIGDLTGPAAPEQGIPQLNGARAAIKYLESSGEIAEGISYEIVTRDAHSDPNVAASSVRELTQSDDLVAILGGGSTEQEQAMMGTINRAGVLNFTSVQGRPFIDELGAENKYPWVYQVSETPEQVVQPLMDYLTSDGEDTVAELYVDIAYGQTQHGVSEKLAQEAGVELVSQSAQVTATTFTAQLEKLKASGAQSLLLWTFGASAAQVMKELKQIGWSPKVGGPLGIANTTVGGAMDAAIADKAAASPVPATFLGAESEQLEGPTKGFYDDYSAEAKDDEVNGRMMVGAYGFDAMILLNQAIKETSSKDPEKLREYLDSGAEIPGARGTYVFGGDSRVGTVPGEDYGALAIGSPCSGGTRCKGLE
jgi:branched-chain amino acid transport system substrate-binding protein